ncbi:MAG: NAD(P)-binding protein [Desulfobacterales bacterium]
MRRIRILGGGIAGLTAAINLARANLAVEIHERKHCCGKSIEDFQFLENWTFKEDALDMLQHMHIEPNFYLKPWYSQEIISPSGKKYVGTSGQPLMYLTKRGHQHGSLDRSLEKQVVRLNIPIVYNSEMAVTDADIIATGVRKPAFIASGVKFALEHPDRSIVILDDRLSFQMYSYLIVNDNEGELVSINPVQTNRHIARLNRTIERFERILGIPIEPDHKRFAAQVSFPFIRPARVKNRYYTGEAAGFQDCLAGFGMMYAFKSGYFAARSIIENRDYDRLWQKDFIRPMEISVRNREIFDGLSNRGYEILVDVLNTDNKVIQKLLGGNDLRQILKKVYNYSIPRPLHTILSSYKRQNQRGADKLRQS